MSISIQLDQSIYNGEKIYTIFIQEFGIEYDVLVIL